MNMRTQTEMGGTNLVDKGGGVVDVEDEGEVDARKDVVARRAVVHRVVVGARVLRDHKRDAVPPVSLVASGRPLAQLDAVALHNARAARRNRQKHLDPTTFPRNCFSPSSHTQKGQMRRARFSTNSAQWADFHPLQ